MFVLGSGSRVAYRAASEDELGELARSGQDEGLEELVWALVLHDGPLSEAALAKRVARPLGELRGDAGAPCSPTVAWSAARTDCSRRAIS